MRCLRVRLVTGSREAQGISRDDNRIVPRGLAEGRWWMPAFVMLAKAPRELKKPRGAPRGEPVSLKDAGSALKARMKIDLLAFSALRPLWGNGKKRPKGGPAPGSTGMRSVGCLVLWVGEIGMSADSMSPSCPRLSRASTSLRSCNAVKTWMGGTGHHRRLRAGTPTSPAMTPRTVDGF